MTSARGPGAHIGLMGVRCFEVPRPVVDELQAFFRKAGEAGCEAVGFWAGVVEGDVFRVREAVIPRQQAIRSPEGDVAVMIPGDELFRLNVWLYRSGLELGAQIHSHPGAAYHSDTDDTLAVVARAGGLSLVVPDFARRPFTLAEAAVHRLGEDGRWIRLEPAAVTALVHLSDEG